MYWGFVFLAVSLLSAPFAAMEQSGVTSMTALILMVVFGLLSALAFLLGREAPRRQPVRDPRGDQRA